MVFLPMTKLKYKPIYHVSPNYLTKVDAQLERAELIVQSKESVTY